MADVDASRPASDPDAPRPLGSTPAPRPERLLRRADFVRVSKGARFHARAFSLQARPRDGDEAPPRFGFTVTRKAGGSVERNRMRRRLREALRRVAAAEARPGHDYVIVARREALDADFAGLARDLARALRQIGRREAKPRGSAPRAPT